MAILKGQKPRGRGKDITRLKTLAEDIKKLEQESLDLEDDLLKRLGTMVLEKWKGEHSVTISITDKLHESMMAVYFPEPEPQPQQSEAAPVPGTEAKA